MGECLKAIPPPPEAEEPLPSTLAEECLPANEAADNSEEEDIFGEPTFGFVPVSAPDDKLIAA